MRISPPISKELVLVTGLFFLPILPILAYFPLALPFGGLLITCLAWYRYYRSRNSIAHSKASSTGPVKAQLSSVNLSGVGFGLGLLALLLASTLTLFQKDSSAISVGTPILALTAGLYFSLSQPLNPQWYQGLRWTSMAMILLCSIWVGAHAIGLNFTELTQRLSYVEGWGNTSQIAMYAALAGLITLSHSGQRVWQWVTVIALLFVLSYLLDSKLLIGVGGLGTLSQVLAKQSVKPKRWLTGGLVLSTVILVLILQPTSLAGRRETLQTAFQGIHWEMTFGVGPGGIEDLFNRLFFSGLVENRIGEIGPIAFNDYLQTLVELGPLGCIGLVLITFNVLRGARPFLALALLGITAVMFPLQYLESSVLWVIAVFGLENKSLVRLPTLPKIKLLIPILTTTALLLLIYQGTLAYLLSRADDHIQADQMEKGFKDYAELEPYFVWTPEFHLKWGQHLQKADQHAQALEKFRMAAGLTPSYSALTHLADACFNEGLYEEAKQRYDQAHLLRPKRLYPPYRKVFCLLETGNIKAAKQLANELVKDFSKPHDPLQATMVEELKSKVLESL